MLEETSGVCLGDYVKISILPDPSQHVEGTVCCILSHKDSLVRLVSGDTGYVQDVFRSEEVAKKRIMFENQYTENKKNFSPDVMHDEVIPKTVQSFLNSQGGYLYIGVQDDGDLNERLVGLDYDFSMINDSANLPNDKLCDILERKIMATLDKYLESDASLGPLVQVGFIRVCGVQIAEIRIRKSPEPWFYKNLAKSCRPKVFEHKSRDGTMTQRRVDDFYIRFGGSKKLLETHSQVCQYIRNNFSAHTSGMI